MSCVQEVLPTMYTGKVMQGLRVNNNDDQDKNAGVIVLRGQEGAYLCSCIMLHVHPLW